LIAHLLLKEGGYMPRQTTAVTPADLNIVVLVGEVTSPLVSRTLATGEIASSFDMSTQTDEGRISVPVAIHGENSTVVVGAQLCVVGVVRRRFFRAGTSVSSRTEVLAHSVSVMRRRAQVRKNLAAALDDITDLLDS
jgi:hypothetical protein